jgi:acetylornithine deacetylase
VGSADPAVALLSSLVAVESINPSLAPSGSGERALATFVASWMREHGLDVETQEPRPGRLNVVGTARGTGHGRSLMLVAHLDTVDVVGMSGPFQAVVENGRLYGRGAYDMKGGLAAALLAASAVAADRLRGDVIVAAVCDEEYESLGVQALVDVYTADAAVVTEPTEMKIAIAHKGFDWFTVEVTGKAAHGSLPHLGVDAIVKTGGVLLELEALERRLRSGPGHPLLGTGTIHASLIRGGQELSSIPASCTLEIERRSIPGEGPERTSGEIHEMLTRLAAADSDFKATHRLLLHRDPFEIDPGHELVQALGTAAGEVLGSEPETVAVSFWADSAFLAAAGIPTVLFGTRGAGAHEAIEWVELADVRACADTLALLARRFCM